MKLLILIISLLAILFGIWSFGDRGITASAKGPALSTTNWVMLSIGSANSVEKGDIIVGISGGSFGTVVKVMNDMALCRINVMVFGTNVGDGFRIY